MLAAKRAAEPDELTAGDATAEALRQISSEITENSNKLVVATAGLDDLPEIRNWLRQQVRSSDRWAL